MHINMNMLPLISFTFLALVAVITGENPRVTIQQGILEGITSTSARGKEIFSFKRIPFAKPPVDNLRFKNPQAAGPWEGILNATEEVPLCPQFDFLLSKKLTGQEDCLYLNVHTPKIPKEDDNVKLPVMFFIHGGAFMLGSSQSILCSPVKLLDRDVVLVATNYRLGALGFLSTGDEVSPGNYGLFDQIEALRWVKKNIVKFGGDPDKVTIFGESAGGASVSHLLVSPKAAGLFHAAILQSGSSFSDWAIGENPKKWAKLLAIKLGCSAHTSQRVVNCLSQKSSEEILSAQQNLKVMPVAMVFMPVVENKPTGFFPNNPINLVAKNKSNKVPTINGVTKNEGAFSVAHFEGIYDLYSPEFLEVDFPEISGVSEMTENKISATKQIVDHYFKNVDRSDKTQIRNTLSQIFSDSAFNVGAERFSNVVSANGVPVYNYILTHRGNSSLTELFGTTEDYGVGHGDELQYMFGSFLGKELNSVDKDLSEIILDLWTNFATTHDPTPGNKLPFKWLKTESKKTRYLDLNPHPKMVEERFTENVAFWTEELGKTTSSSSWKYEL